MKHDYTMLLHFLNTGELGQIKMGITVEEAQQILGHPSPTALFVHTKHGWINYGCLKLFIGNDRVRSISIELHLYPEYDLPGDLGRGWLSEFSLIETQKLTQFLAEHYIPVDSTGRTIDHQHLIVRFHPYPENFNRFKSIVAGHPIRF